MQVPLVVVLAGKVNLVGMLLGSSYERLNWLHRWVARTMFICVTIHGGFFLNEWVRADFIALELQTMPVVKYGMAAWFLLLWINITGLVPLRRLAYEVFVLQHILSGAAFLWLIYLHAPVYARFYVWIAIGFMLFDRAARIAWGLFRNVNVFRTRRTISRLADRVGYRAELQVVPGDTTTVTIKNVPWKWTPGQHIYLSIPRVGFVEAHPFTITNTPSKDSKQLSTATIAIRAHNGFTKRLHGYATKNSSPGRPTEVRAFVQGPYGAHPTWNTFETVVLISASTGASFTLPILESVIEDPGCVRNVTYMLIVRQRPQCSCYLDRLREAGERAFDAGLSVRIEVVVTGQSTDSEAWEGTVGTGCACGPDTPAESCCCGGHNGPTEKTGAPAEDSEADDDAIQVGGCCSGKNTAAVDADKDAITTKEAKLASSQLSGISTSKSYIEFSSAGRPDLAECIRVPVEAAQGESCIAVCGGRSLAGYVRNAVARLSDERAVHKGTGAQGICLHVEEFGL